MSKLSNLRTISGRVGLVLAALLAASLFFLVGSVSTAEPAALSPHTGATCSQTAPFPFPSKVVGVAATPDDGGYWIVTSGGYVAACGDAPYLGEQTTLNAPIVGIAATTDGGGYYLVASDGGIFTFGDAVFQGSTGSVHLNKPVAGMAVDPATGGYWLVATDGGIFAYDAPFLGSTGSLTLNKPVVGMATNNNGSGYWLVAADGGIFAYGVPFWGSTGSIHLNKPVVGMASDATSSGYWLVASDGGIFAYNAPFYGSTGSIVLNAPVVGMEATATGSGYRFIATDGGIFAYGSSQFYGTPVFARPPAPPAPSPTPSPVGGGGFVQADDTGTFNGNATSIGSGQYNQVLAHNTGIGHSVVLEIQTLTDPGTQTDTVTSVTSAMGTFQFVNSYNDGADTEIWVCLDTTGAADTLTVNTPTNAWDAFAVEFNAPATGFINGGGQVTNPNYLGNQSWTVSPGAAGNIAVMAVDTLGAYVTGPAAPWTYYNSGYWDFPNGTSAAWQVAPSSAPLTATWETDGGLSSSQGVVLEY